MQRIGLTGGIAAGKSVAARRLRELGAVVIDSDELAREAVAPGSPGLDAVVDEFGEGVVAADGTLDRAALASVVFADAGARARLDAIVHPVVRRLAAEREAAAAVLDHGAVVVHDIPLLVETGQADAFHVLVVVHAPAVLRVERLVRLRGMTREDAEARVAAQAADDARLAVADVVLDGTGSDADLRAQVDDLWDRLAVERADEIAAETP
ncbi:dephospho-CoA kinase [Cellulomonas fimi]|uniref:Dephospho-CoA kinase n=1 Tax=Cellulomonas fimi (strain ATCC 484 / DSM 20113 / JCM 1341 / CCUG 24087 / LMG 16345 / NBRC 15513 / NCIMB 8980 / NCTC 7547 / NRS-133) TaxID=590998 RepID=F4GYY9_CELFA|nr:dephospho-CoA kinase [Cellulomonas fimi]AEE45979.1 dephospho-CoA kinase [Cellulomonas fimi ATCC 484]NNH06565.1 dephospho-CoA kinase [Cellulomonas fimi]VEH31179.1 Dephospho-CoA kinase [Cellulomonas fimi]